MTTRLPRFLYTVSDDAADRLEALAGFWGLTVPALTRCLMERVAELVQVTPTDHGEHLTRGFPFPVALLPLLLPGGLQSPDDTEMKELRLILDLYRPDGSRPSATFRPCDVKAPVLNARSVEDGATAPPANRRSRKASPPSSNTGVVSRSSPAKTKG